MTDAEIIAFIRHEARLIDEQRFDEWLAMFTEDGRYWMPLDPAQTDWKLQQSLYSEDVFLLRLRCEAIDYTNLDDHPAFPGRTSTTERVAEYVAKELAKAFMTLAVDARPTAGATLRVLLRESPVAFASFERAL